MHLGGIRFNIIELAQKRCLDDLRPFPIPALDGLAVFFRKMRRSNDLHPPAPPYEAADARQDGKERRRGKEADRPAIAAGPRKQRYIEIVRHIITEGAVLGPDGYIGQTHTIRASL